MRELEPSLYMAFNPWDEITTPDALAGLFTRAGIPQATTEALTGEQPLEHPDWTWDIVLGSGLRATVEALTGKQRELLRERFLDQLRRREVPHIRTDVV